MEVRPSEKIMKILCLVRHGKAVPREGESDLERGLSDIGKLEVRAMSKRLKKKGIFPDVMIANPAVRVLETAHIFAKALDYTPENIVIHQENSNDDQEQLQAILRSLSDDYTTAMLIGHNPAISELAQAFLQNFDLEIRTSSVVGVLFNVKTWQAIATESAILFLYDFPVRVSPKAYKNAKKAISKELTQTMGNLLEHIDGNWSKHLKKIIEKTSKRLAKEVLKVLQFSTVEDLAGMNRLQVEECLDSPEFLPSVESENELFAK